VIESNHRCAKHEVGTTFESKAKCSINPMVSADLEKTKTRQTYDFDEQQRRVENKSDTGTNARIDAANFQEQGEFSTGSQKLAGLLRRTRTYRSHLVVSAVQYKRC
jgi:hypothetical protein